MTWQLREPSYWSAIRELVGSMGERCALAGTTGVQIHVAAAVGLDKLGPPAHAIEVVAFDAATVPDRVGEVRVRRADALGFEASIAANRTIIALGDERFPVASPEHILGMSLAAAELPTDVKWACFILMRTYEGRLDLEEVRGFLKRAASIDRQALLAELAYLAA